LNRAERLILVLGEGAAAGLLAGGVLGVWSVSLNQDLPHGMLRMAALRLARPMAIGGTSGLLLSAAVAVLMVSLGRLGRGAVWAGIAGLLLVWGAGFAAVAYPLREMVLPLHRYSGHGVTITVFILCAGACLLLLARRASGALRHRDGQGGARSGIGRLRTACAGGAILATALALVLAFVRPVIARSADLPSIVLVSIDTLRADRLGVMGNTRGLTPTLDRLATEGLLFEQATSPAPWTLPAHASLFTSRLPHDLRRHWDFTTAVHVRWTLLAERLYEAGYRTAAFTGAGYVSSQFGFSQGFEVFDEHDEALEGGPEKILAPALAWARSVAGAPFFLFVHTYEPHYPYVHLDRARPEDVGRLPPTFTIEEVEVIHRGEIVPTPAERRYITDLYDGDVAYADRVVGGFLSTLEREGILDRALLVVVSDHGEELWDHDTGYSPDHGHTLYQELIHVPLILRWPGKVPAGRRIRTPVSLIDVAPTLLALAGLPADRDHRGRSLAGTLSTGEEPDPAPIMAESVQYGPDRFLVREGDLKVVLTPYPDRLNSFVAIPARPLEIFDLAADPLEHHDLSAHLTDPAAGMVDLLWQRAREVVSERGAVGPKTPPLPDELLEQLRSLGYLR
jgi:arylsulfatase A-like enzyme